MKTSPFDVLEAEFVGAIAKGSDAATLPAAALEIAFAGRSNVGKSSLINALVQRKGLVRTSNTPGCTRQINFFSAKARDQVSLVLVDLPGYGFAKRAKSERSEWALLIESYLEKRSSLRALALLVDARRGLEEEEAELLAFMARRKDVTVILVATKLDKLPKSQAASLLAKLKKQATLPVIGFSAVDGTGWDAVWGALRKAAGIASVSPQASA